MAHNTLSHYITEVNDSQLKQTNRCDAIKPPLEYKQQQDHKLRPSVQLNHDLRRRNVPHIESLNRNVAVINTGFQWTDHMCPS